METIVPERILQAMLKAVFFAAAMAGIAYWRHSELPSFGSFLVNAGVFGILIFLVDGWIERRRLRRQESLREIATKIDTITKSR